MYVRFRDGVTRRTGHDMRKRLVMVVLVLAVAGLSGCTSVADVGNPPEARPDHQPELAAPTAAETAAANPVINLAATAPGGGIAPSPAVSPSPTRVVATPLPATPTPVGGPTPRPSPPPVTDPSTSQLFYHGTSNRKEVALTFDAGDDRGNAAKILDILEQYGIKGTIGLTGKWAQQNPDLVQRMVADGDMLINHTWDHTSFTGESDGLGGLSHDERVAELTKTEAFIKKLTGYELKPYFRPPYADYDDATLSDVASIGYTITVMWSCDTMGWNGATADEIVAHCTDPSKLKPGEIILMHVGSASQDAEALPALIEAIQAKGYTFVTVEQVLQP